MDITSPTQFRFKLAEYNKETEKLAFNTEDVLDRIKKIWDTSKGKIVFATAVGHSKSGKTKALNRLLKQWNGLNATGKNFQSADDDFQGIQLMLTNTTKVFENEEVCLACLDVVCDPGNSSVYRILMEICCRISDLVIFAFSKENENKEVIGLKLENKNFKVAASFSGYDWSVHPVSFFPNPGNLLFNVAEKDFDGAADIRKAVIALSKATAEFPVQLEPENVDSTDDLCDFPTEDIYSTLINSLADSDFINTLSASSKIMGIFTAMEISTLDDHSRENQPQTSSQQLRLRSTPLSEAEAKEKLDLEISKLKIITSFRSLAMKAICSAETTELHEYSKLSSLIEEWSTADQSGGQPSSELYELRKVLRSELEGCHRFFTSYQSVVDDYFQGCPYLSLDQLKKLETELKEKLQGCMTNFQQEMHYLKTLCNGVLATIVLNIEAHNQDIVRTEELLADMTCGAAFKAYIVSMGGQLKENIWSAADVRNIHQTIQDCILNTFTTEQEEDSVVWKHRIKCCTERMGEHVQEILTRNAQRLSQLRENTSNAYETCKIDFERFFARKSDFCSLGDLKEEGEAALTMAFDKLKKEEKHLPQAGITEVRQMLTNYAFESMLQCASNPAHATPVVARKSHVTILLGFKIGDPIRICSPSLVEPIWLDSRLWLYDGNLVIIDSRQVQRFLDYHPCCAFLSVNSLTYGRVDDQAWLKHDVSVAIVKCTHREQVIAVYFKKVKQYLLEHYHLIPTKLTVVVDDSTKFIAKHRINSAIRLAGLASPNFMFLSGAAATGYLRSGKFDSISKTLFLMATSEQVFSATFEVNGFILVTPSLTRNEYDFDGIFKFVVEKINNDSDSQQLVFLHDLPNRSSDFEAIKDHLPRRITSCRIDTVTAEELALLVYRGAAQVQRLFEAAYYENFDYNVNLHRYGPHTIKQLVKSGSFIRSYCTLDIIDPSAMVSGNVCRKIKTSSKASEDLVFHVKTSVEQLGSVWTLRKDGILCEPEIFVNNQNLPVDWEMSGPLMPWNHQDFKNVEDPEREIWRLLELEKAPMRLKRIGSVSNGNSTEVPVVQPGYSQEQNEGKDDLKTLLAQLEQGLEQPTVPASVVKKARSKLEEAKLLLESEDVQTLDIIKMAERLKLLIEIVNDSVSV